MQSVNGLMIATSQPGVILLIFQEIQTKHFFMSIIWWSPSKHEPTVVSFDNFMTSLDIALELTLAIVSVDTRYIDSGSYDSIVVCQQWAPIVTLPDSTARRRLRSW